MNWHLSLLMLLLLAVVPAGAQSVGGGGGGDRPTMIVPVSAHQKKVPALPRLVPSQMTCNEFAEASAQLKRYRVDVQGYSVRHFIVLMDKSVIGCSSVPLRTAYPVRTLDREKCVVAYYCSQGMR